MSKGEKNQINIGFAWGLRIQRLNAGSFMTISKVEPGSDGEASPSYRFYVRHSSRCFFADSLSSQGCTSHSSSSEEAVLQKELSKKSFVWPLQGWNVPVVFPVIAGKSEPQEYVVSSKETPMFQEISSLRRNSTVAIYEEEL